MQDFETWLFRFCIISTKVLLACKTNSVGSCGGNIVAISFPNCICIYPFVWLQVFVEFNSVAECQKAQEALKEVKIAGHGVITSYYDPRLYRRRDLPVLKKYDEHMNTCGFFY